MPTWVWILLILFAVLVILPIAAYMIMKFGATGFFRAREERGYKSSSSREKDAD